MENDSDKTVYDHIYNILIKLTDTLGYDDKNQAHINAYHDARKDLENLFDKHH